MADAHLAQEGGMTVWILTDETLPPNHRPILCSCESFRKRSLTRSSEGHVEENVVHGIASVFCAEEYRGRGYPSRMMKELAKKLYVWQTEDLPCVGSILYSDIGKSYYARLGWEPSSTNSHVELEPLIQPKSSLIKDIGRKDLYELCRRDEAMIRRRMGNIDEIGTKTLFTIIPDLDHMLWHIAKEYFSCRHIFNKVPEVHGAIAGSTGDQVWAIWTHRYYSHLEAEIHDNVLYILRLVIETGASNTQEPINSKPRTTGDPLNEKATSLKAVLEAAQIEAAAWGLDIVKLWHPSDQVLSLLPKIGIEHLMVEREEDAIASILWYDSHGFVSTERPSWINNEYYAWC